MKQKQHLYFGIKLVCIILCTQILVQCKSELELNEISQNANKINSFEMLKTASGTDYLGHTFYLESTDGIKSIDTRSTEAKGVLSRSFIIQSKSQISSYLGVHVMAALTDESGTLQKIDVFVNDEYVGELDINKAEWDFVTLKDGKTIKLEQGNNKIAFVSYPPFYPEIDAIQVESSPEVLLKEDPLYNDFILALKEQKNNSSEKVSQDDVDQMALKLNLSSTRSAYDQSYNWQVTPRVLNNPDGNYKHMVLVPVTYTYHRKLSLTQGTHTFITSPIDGDSYYTVDPVMYLYKIDDPHTYSYYSDDTSGFGFHPKITATIPSGDYYLVIRAYSSSYASSPTGRCMSSI